MLDIFVPAFVTLLVAIDPPGCVPIFASLTAGTSRPHQKTMAIRSVLIAGMLLLAFAFVGDPLLGALGISMDAFRTAGGVLLFLIALDMVFEKRTERRESRAEKVAKEAEDKHHPLEEEDISVFPMAMPMLAGPGSIASIVLLMSRASGSWESQAAVLAALACVLAITFLGLLAAGPLLKLMGKTVSAVISRLLGVILAALAAQFVFDGIKHAFNF
ncbi:MarC family protein [Pedomonas mirosovicensis]|uniref:MarC family protein n=1 Tax=Pedomonas mirosovicensis TaxID=2908641 RepID=UPI002167952D|nr:MarC family protein [Pedomonas mirosovicensis]MCH8684089.1 MarC family protein [Pedomonas mirosovicensis]